MLRKLAQGADNGHLIHPSEKESFSSTEEEKAELNFLTGQAASQQSTTDETDSAKDAEPYQDFINFLQRNLKHNSKCVVVEPTIEMKLSNVCSGAEGKRQFNEVSRLFLGLIGLNYTFGHSDLVAALR